MTRTSFRSTYAISQGIMASDEVLRDDRAAVVRLLGVYADACRVLKSGPDRAIGISMKYQVGSRALPLDGYKAIAHGPDWTMPMREAVQVPAHVAGIRPARVAPPTARFRDQSDYGPLAETSGDGPRAGRRAMIRRPPRVVLQRASR